MLPSPITDVTRFFIPLDTNTQLPKTSKRCTILCKRDDLIHPVISGNKWRKLSASLGLISRENFQHVISFGGAYSNHLHALSYACAAMNIKCTAVVRGDYRNHLTPTLQDMKKWGCSLHFVSKLDYKKRDNTAYCEELKRKLQADFVIPEGGSNTHCLQGVSAILKELSLQVPDLTHIVLPVASAGTLAGLLSSNLLPGIKIIGIGVLKGEGYLEELACNLVKFSARTNTLKTWHICHEYHHGGYAKTSPALNDFVSDFNRYYQAREKIPSIEYDEPSLPSLYSPKSEERGDNEHTLIIEPVYSGKCFYALKQLLMKGDFPANSKVVVLHTGGLQGLRI